MKAFFVFIQSVTGLCREVSRAYIETGCKHQTNKCDPALNGPIAVLTVGIINRLLRTIRKWQPNKNVPQHGPVTCSSIHQSQTSFDDVFSERNIILCLLKEREKLRKARHNKQFYHLVSQRKSHGQNARPDLAEDLKGLFPSRRQWSKYRPSGKTRKKQHEEDINQVALERAVFDLLKKNPNLPWLQNLRKRVAIIRERALEPHCHSFTPPRIIGVRKHPKLHEYRPISMYATDDKIIQKLTTRYLNQNLDFCFSSSSLAYRCMRKNMKPQLNRDTALAWITEFAARHPEVFVGEADLRNCMDCIDHEIVKIAWENLINNGIKVKSELEIDQRALRILEAYLESFSFQTDVLGKALGILRKQDPLGNFPWPSEILARMHGSDELEKIGIPQGGSLSCFLTNLVLHTADLAVNGVHVSDGHEILYLRYCDDMLILATSKELCQKAMDAYKTALEFIKLPMHEPVDVGKDVEYREAKSKNPYRWSAAKVGGIPWIQFLGYEFRNDGRVRIRQKSLDKQCDKITKEVDKLLQILKPRKKSREGIAELSPGLRMHPVKIQDRIHRKLIAMSVGRIGIGEQPPSCVQEIKPMCWANGYKSLWDVSYNPNQLRGLDRHRESELKRVHKTLKPLREQNTSDKSLNIRIKNPRFYGSPFSYHRQFAGKGKPLQENQESTALILHPKQEQKSEASGIFKRLRILWSLILETIFRCFITRS